MKLTKLFLLIISGLLSSGLLLAQEPLDFFPHHQGDVWEYWVDAGPGGFITKQNEITKDSLGSDGRYYIETSWFGKFVIDTTTFEVFKSYGTLDKLYKLDADSGEAWIVWEDGSGGGHYIGVAVVSDVYQELLFNQPVIIKVIDYYDYEIGAPESLWTETRYLAGNFGLVQSDVDLSYPYYFIRGAIIDSVRYGTVTSNGQGVELAFPQNLNLYQNYPNPFNSITTIQYDLPVSAKVELNVYNLMGGKVKTLVNTIHMAGSYRVPFDASQLSSGVYFYRLKINNEDVSAKKMILLK